MKSILKYLLLPLVLIVFYILFYFVYEDIKMRTIEEFSQEQLILAETAAQGIYSFIIDSQSDLAFMSGLNDVLDNTEYGKIMLANFYENHKNHIEAVTRVDSSGKIVYTFPVVDSVIGEDISYQKHVQEILATHRPVVSDVFESVQGYLAIAIHVPVFKNEVFAGSLAMLIPIKNLGERYLGKIEIRGAGSVWLFTENGYEIYGSTDDQPMRSLAEIKQHARMSSKLLEILRNEQSGTLKNKQYLRQNKNPDKMGRFLAFYRTPLGNTYWTIVIAYQEEDIYLTLTRLRNRLIIIFSLLVVILSYYFYSLAKVRQILKADIKRKEAEKILRESEEKFRTIFDESPIGIEFYNADGMQLNANKASIKMFGIMDVNEILRFNLFDGVSLSDDFKEKLRNGEQISYQAYFDFDKVNRLKLYKTGRSGGAYFYYIITPLKDTTRQVVNGYLVQVQDITEQKRAEEEIITLAHALRSVNECVSITDVHNKIIFVNEAFCKTYGYKAEELTGKDIDILRSAKDTSVDASEILKATKLGGWKGELINKRKNGSEFPIFLSTTIIQDKEGKPLGLIGVASDITERKKTEKELIAAKEKAEESDRLKSAFLANMSHEIRTPMNGILGFADLLKEPQLTGEQQHHYIRIIENSGARMLNIINDIIDISKIEAGLVEISMVGTSIREQLEFTYNFFKPEAEKKGLLFTLQNNVPEKYQNILTDREKLYAILANLVKNAIKFTRSGSIELGCENKTMEQGTSPVLQFYVKDTGIGIGKERQGAIFDRFVQADIEDKKAYQGAGLGLSITRAYVEMLGGTIHVKSEPDKGSVFYFTLPYQPAHDQQHDREETDEMAMDAAQMQKSVLGLKILIAEDDEISEMYLNESLGSTVKELLVARSGNEAVDLCKKNPDLHLILMDIKMPGFDGYEATRRIRQFNKEVIIIAQTAYGLAGDREKAIDAGCNDYIAKPIVGKLLIKLIEKYFK